jgi:hypothetical protein
VEAQTTVSGLLGLGMASLLVLLLGAALVAVRDVVGGLRMASHAPPWSKEEVAPRAHRCRSRTERDTFR